MCWSGEASTVLAAVGLSTATYVAHKGESKELWIPLTYFALMELLQAATYVYIDLCGLPQNQILTLLGYVHIAFQPFFVNMIGMYFIPAAVKERISTRVYAVCGAAALGMLIKMYPFDWTGPCRFGEEVFCGPLTCSVSGDWHIAWMMPLNNLSFDWLNNLLGVYYGLHGWAYIGAGFLLPLLYGSWRFLGFHLIAGPMVSNMLTRDPNEYAAVWCLFSIALCVSVIKTPLRRWLHVERWPLFTWMGYRRKEEEEGEGEPAYSDEQA